MQSSLFVFSLVSTTGGLRYYIGMYMMMFCVFVSVFNNLKVFYFLGCLIIVILGYCLGFFARKGGVCLV